MQQENSSTSSFRKFAFTYFIPFMMISGVLLLLFTVLFEQVVILGSDISGAYKVNRVLSAKNENEIPIFGSSRAEGSFIPSMLGDNYFNYGMAGTQENVMLVLMQIECKKKKKQPIVLVNFDLEGINSSLGDPSNYLYNSRVPAVKRMMGDEWKEYYRIPVIKYYGQFETYMKYFVNQKMQLTKFTDKGASIEKNVLSPEKFAQLVKERENSETRFENDPALTWEFLNLIKSYPKRHFVIVISPYHKSYWNKFVNYPDADAFLKNLASNSNVTIFDFSKENYPDHYFLNTTHLNYDGAVVFNKALRDSLERL